MSSAADIAQSKDVLISTVQRFSAIDVSDNVPNIQFPSLAIEVEPGATANRFIDAKAYDINFVPELETIAQLERLALQGQEHVCMLYAYRSISKAIPQLVSLFFICVK